MNDIKIIFILIFILAFVGVYSFTTYNKNNQIEIELKNSIKDLKRHYDITQYHNTNTADSVFYTLPQNKKIMDILSKALNSTDEEKKILREELNRILTNKFEALKKEGANMIMFSLPDNTAFLRIHRPDKFGDDLRKVRLSIKNVNERKKSLHGFEQGKVSHAFRNIYPLIAEDSTYFGALDISFSSESVQETLDAVNKIHSHFLVRKDILSQKIWNNKDKESAYFQSIEHKDFLIAETKEVTHLKIDISKETIKNNQEYINQSIGKSKEFAIYGAKDNDLIVISFLPIKNILDTTKTDAYIVSYTSNAEIQKILKMNKWINVLFFFFLSLTFYLIYNQIAHKSELKKEVDKKTKELKQLNENLEEEIKKETLKNREKDKQLYEHAKNAQMGEMIGNIAHQWRQPLSLISTVSSGLKLKIELNIFEKEEAIKELELLNDTSQHLSKTIDIFRDYIKSNKELKNVVLQDRINYSITIVESSLSSKHIKIINEIDYSNDIHVELVVGELSEVLINIFNNAKDAFDDRDIQEKWVKISLEDKENIAVIIIEDNAGGIPDEILPKVFDPYFTTKHQSQGTGIGLYMSSQIVSNHLNGKIYAQNSNTGAKFFIEIPKKT